MNRISVYIIIYFTFISCSCLNAQTAERSFLFRTLKSEIAFSASKGKEKILFPFNSIHFIDARPIPSLCGFYTKSNGDFGKYVFKHDLETEFGNYASGALQLSPDASGLLIAIKKFWLSDFLADSLTYGKKLTERTVVLEAEVYLKNAGYFNTFFRIDTVLNFASGFSSINGEDACLNALDFLFSKCMEMPHAGVIKQNRKFTYEEIQSHLNKGFMIPILSDTVFTKGIYYTFADFKNNKPAPGEFIPCAAESDCSGNVFAVNESGEKELISDYWGFSDGQQVYIHYRRNILPAIKVSNALFIAGENFKKTNAWSQIGFFLLSSGTGLKITDKISFITDIRTQTKSKKQLPVFPLLLDWDTGKFY